MCEVKSMQGNKDTLILRSRTVPRNISDKINLSKEIKKLSPLNTHLMDIEKQKTKAEPTKMASEEVMVDMLKKHKMERSFKPQRFGGRTTENGEEFLSAFNNYCKLNNVDRQEKLLIFEMLLVGPARCWFLTQSEETKKNFDRLADQFKTDYLKNNKWLNSTRLENRKLLSSESAEKYIADMSELALLVGIKEEELSKALIRGLPPKLRWHVVSFNPTSLSETIQRILLGEATLSFTEEKTEINEISDSFALLCTRLEERVGRLEDLNKTHATNEKTQYQGPLCFRCGKRGHFAAQCFRPRMYEDNNSQRGRGFQPPQYNRNPGRGQYDNSQNRNYYGRAVSPRGFGRGFDSNYRMQKNEWKPRV